MAKGVTVQPLRTNNLFIHTQAQISFLACHALQKKKVQCEMKQWSHRNWIPTIQ